ncbi:MAG: FBP domain-containing protein [Oxalobacteraceae bacterium]|nr:MAG: FBP domain-containing protein [Oxalobacteraceae bacterium]
MQSIDQAAVRRAFVNASRSRTASATFPARWPDDLDERDLVGWVDPKAPLRAYLVTDVGDDLAALELRMPGSSGSRRKSMCDLCHAMDAPEGSLLVVAQRAGARGRSGDTVGLYVCSDFECSVAACTSQRVGSNNQVDMVDRVDSGKQRRGGHVVYNRLLLFEASRRDINVKGVCW